MLMKHSNTDPHIHSELYRNDTCYEISMYQYTAKRVNTECFIFQNLQSFHGNKALKE